MPPLGAVPLRFRDESAASAEGEGEIPDEELPENVSGYVAPKKVTVGELLEKDQDDESLKRYKEALLGSGAEAAPASEVFLCGTTSDEINYTFGVLSQKFGTYY